MFIINFNGVDASENPSEILSHTHQIDILKRRPISIREDVEKEELYTVLMNIHVLHI